MTKWLSGLRKGEEGVTLVIVMLMMTVGSLLIVPTLSFVSTSVQTGEVFEEKLEALYAAEAGVEEALWIMVNEKPESFPHPMELTGINGMTVDVVIEALETIAGIEIGSTGGHSDYLEITKTVTYNYGTGRYEFSLELSNVGNGNIWIYLILIDFPPDLEFVPGSTGGDFCGEDPTIVGDSGTGITIYWEFDKVIIVPEATGVHTFQLEGEPDIPGVEGHGYARATREDVGVVWDANSHPFVITAQAKDDTDTVVSTVRAGLWWRDSGQVSITCWQVNP